MAVKLSILYKDIHRKYDLKLLTTSFFNQEVEWFHIIDNVDFSQMLNGRELIFNSSFNQSTYDEMQYFLEQLIQANACGLFIAMESEHTIPDSIIEFCNQQHFPLIMCAWNTSFLEIMRRFSEILLSEERNITNLIGALKTAFFYPSNEQQYLGQFEINGFMPDMDYIVTILRYHNSTNPEKLNSIQKSLHFLFEKYIHYINNDELVVLIYNVSMDQTYKIINSLCNKEHLYAGIGQSVHNIKELSLSYETAHTACCLAGTTIHKKVLLYDELGVYQLLTDVKHSALCDNYVTNTLGPLIQYDADHHTDYLHILQVFFEYECSIIHTSEALYCHKNTLHNKMNVIRDILGCDLTSNQSRANIMLAFAILKLQSAS